MGYKGIDVRQSGDRLIFRASLKDSSGAKVTTGTATLRLFEVQNDGSLKSYDFNDNTFKTTALTTATVNLVHRQGNNSTYDTGLWSYSLTTITGFTRGNVYISQISHASASPPEQEREFQYGEGEGDESIDANGRVDLGKWIGTAPLALSSQRVQATSTVTGTISANDAALRAALLANNGTAIALSDTSTNKVVKFAGLVGDGYDDCAGMEVVFPATSGHPRHSSAVTSVSFNSGTSEWQFTLDRTLPFTPNSTDTIHIVFGRSRIDSTYAVANKLDGMLVVDGPVYQFTANALELGGGGGGSGLTEQQVRDAMLLAPTGSADPGSIDAILATLVPGSVVEEQNYDTVTQV